MSEALRAAMFGAVLLLGLIGAGRWLAARVPMSKARRAALRRLQPVLEAGLVGVYLIVVLPLAFADELGYLELLPAAAFVALVWFALRDLVAGVLVKASELCEVGDHVDLGGQSGVVRQLGYRVLVLSDEQGAELVIPYSQLSTRSLVRMRHNAAAYPHSFELELPPESDPLEARARIKRLAMGSHWASIVREPEIEALSGGRVAVRVFALGREYGPAIEAQVRAELA